MEKKKEFKETALASGIRKFIYSFRRWKRENKFEIKAWKKLNFWLLVFLVNIGVGMMFASALVRWFLLGEY